VTAPTGRQRTAASERTASQRTPSRRTALRRSSPVVGEQHLAGRVRARSADSRRGWLRRLALGLGVVVGGGALAWVLLASTWLAVEEVTVAGTSRLSPADVIAAADVRAGVPLARLDVAAVEARVRRLAPVADVEAVRSWPRTVHLQVIERQPVAAHVGREGVRLLDAAGVPFVTVPAVPDGLLQLEVAAPRPGDPATAAALDVATDLPPELRSLVAGVDAASASSVTLLLSDGRTVVWGSPGDTATKAAAVRALLPMPGTTFDVSTPGVAVRR
jgi:cell division protein FtsQ